MENNELKPKVNNVQEPIVIGEIKKEKNAGPLGVFLFFGFLVLFAIFLPNITEYVNNFFNKEKTIAPIVDTEEKKDDVEDEKQEVTYYEITSDLTFTINNLTFNNFIKANNLLTFTVKNNQTGSYTFRTENYYIEFYDNTNMLLERIRINNNAIIPKSETEDISIPIKNNNATKFKIFNIQDNNYPSINLTEDENKLSKLSCTNNISTIDYNLTDKKLTSLTEKVNLNNTTHNYVSLIEEYRNINSRLLGTDGVSINFQETENNFIFEMTVDYTKLNRIEIDDLKYYNKNTEAKVINFELEASGFNCS